MINAGSVNIVEVSKRVRISGGNLRIKSIASLSNRIAMSIRNVAQTMDAKMDKLSLGSEIF